MHHTATHCTTLQHTATHCQTHTATNCSTLHHTAAHCNTLQHTAAHCSTLQHTGTHCQTRAAHYWLILCQKRPAQTREPQSPKETCFSWHFVCQHMPCNSMSIETQLITKRDLLLMSVCSTRRGQRTTRARTRCGRWRRRLLQKTSAARALALRNFVPRPAVVLVRSMRAACVCKCRG